MLCVVHNLLFENLITINVSRHTVHTHPPLPVYGPQIRNDTSGTHSCLQYIIRNGGELIIRKVTFLIFNNMHVYYYYYYNTPPRPNE